MCPGSLDVPASTDDAAACTAARELFLRIGDKWTLVVVGVLWDGSRRFSEIRSSVPGLSQRMLTLTLRNLERDGLVTRSVTPTVPVRTDYALTPRGRSLGERVRGLSDWAYEHHREIAVTRAEFDSRTARKALIRAAGT